MTDRELMQQALEALDAYSWEQVQVATNALRDRLAQPEQEPVAWYDKHGMVTHDPFEGIRPLYAAPRQWVGLTKEEAKEISLANRPYVIDMIAALEARLKEKNT